MLQSLMLNGSSALTLMFEPINKRRPVLINGLENETCLVVQTTTSWLESVQDFLIKLELKPLMHL